MAEKKVLANVTVEEVDSLTYGELMAIHASASALNVEGEYVFMVYDDSLFIGEYDNEEFKVYRVVRALKIDINAIELSLKIFKKPAYGKPKTGKTRYSWEQ